MRTVIVRNVQEEEISPSDNKVKFRIRREAVDGGEAVYVSLASQIPLSAEKTLTLVPENSPNDCKFVAIENHSPYWCRPVFGDKIADLPKKVQALLMCAGEDRYRYILPVCSDIVKTVIEPYNRAFSLLIYTSCEACTEFSDQLAYIDISGDDPEELYNRGARIASSLLGSLPLRADRKYPEALEYLGWCSWDAFQIRVTHKDLVDKANEFKDKKVPVGFAIIDDMWADVPSLLEIPNDASFRDMVRAMHKSQMHDFCGDPVRFPSGIGAAVDDLKKNGIRNVGIWFPTTGYWRGFMRDGAFARENSRLLCELADGSYSVDPRCADEYFSVLVSRCVGFGADFLKIDNQGCHTRFKNIMPIGESGRKMQTAIDNATKTEAIGLINCMGMPSECMYNRPCSAISRCSDDFIPESREWFTKNILQCAYNGILQGRFFVNDWDMFWSDDEQAVKNSVCRAISGGPVYVSDKLGRTVPERLAPLCLSDGRLLRCGDSAVPTADCLLTDPTRSKRALKVKNKINGACVLAAFNVDGEGKCVCGEFSPTELGFDTDCVIYEFFTRECAIVGCGDLLSFGLENNDSFRLYTVIPAEYPVVPIGRTDKYVGVGAVSSFDGETLEVCEAGEISFAVPEDVKVRVLCDGNELRIDRRGILCTVDSPSVSVRIVRCEE